MKLKIKNLINMMVFLSLTLLLLLVTSYISSTNITKKQQKNLLDTQANNSIDVAYIGSSAAHSFFDPMALWESEKITSLTYSIPSAPFDLTIPLMELALENQSPELFVIDLRSLIIEEYLYTYLGTYYRESIVLDMTNGVTTFDYDLIKLKYILDSPYLDIMEYLNFFDVLYFHNNFLENSQKLISNTNAIFEPTKYKGNMFNQVFQFKSFENIEYNNFSAINDGYVLSEHIKGRIQEVFEYCDENGYEAFFVFTPYMYNLNGYDAQIRYAIGEYILEEGYNFKDYKDSIYEIGLDFAQDFSDIAHTNVWGAEKFTIYFAEDMMRIYNLESESNEEIINDWDNELALWHEFLEVKEITERT